MRFSPSNRYHFGSPRIRLVKTIELRDGERSEDLIISTLHSLLEVPTSPPSTIPHTIKKISVPTKKQCRPSFNENDICEFLGITPEEANSVAESTSQEFGTSLIDYYSREVRTNGLIAWRVRSASMQVILLNNYDSEKGDFKVCDTIEA